jgi:uncharacterized protein GlcG (DUF336 family)
MPLTLAQAQELIAGAHEHARANDWRVAVAVVDEGGLLVALARMDGAFPLSPQIAEARAIGAALWHQDGRSLIALQEARPAFFEAVSSLVRLPLEPGDGSLVIRAGGVALGAVGVSGALGEDDGACAEAGLRGLSLG